MKIKRKHASSGVKSSNNCETKSEIISRIITSKLQIRSNDKSSDKNADQTNGTTNGSLTSGLKNVLEKKSTDLASVKNVQFKEKKKQANNISGTNKILSTENNGPTNQLKVANSSSKENENDKSRLANDRLSTCDKEANECNLSTTDKNKSAVNNSPIMFRDSSSVIRNKTTENTDSDLPSKVDSSSTSSRNAKRELDSSPSDLGMKKKLKFNNETPITATNVSTMTESECLGFAEPGTSVVLEGAVLDEIEGVLVVNVSWRGKMYVGTLLDCSKHNWAPPRFCESPTSDLESRGYNRNRNCKRSRGSISESENNIKLQPSKLRNGKGRRNFTVPESPVREQPNNGNTKQRSNNSKSDNSSANKQRFTPPLDQTTTNHNSSQSSNTQSNQANKSQLSLPVLIECPEPNCNKKYKHINGLKYHQAHAHHDAVNNNNTSKAANNGSPPLNPNKNDESCESAKINEETDTEEFAESETTSLCQPNNKNKANPNKAAKNSRVSKVSGEERNKSPFSDISDTDSDSKPSINEQASQFTTNSSAKNDEINESPATINSQTNLLDTSKSSNSKFTFLCHPSSANNASGKSPENHNGLNLSLTIKEDQKSNEELRKISIEVDKKPTTDVPQHSTDKLIQSDPSEATLQLNNTSTVLAKTNTGLFPPPDNSMNPALHAFLIQTDLNYRMSYERYLIEHQEKLIGSLTSNELSELEKERHSAFLLAQNCGYINSNNQDDNIFKSPPTTSANSNPNRPSSTKSNDHFVSGGSIVNGTSNLSQLTESNANNKSTPSPYDFMESERQFERQREEMFRLSNSFKIEEQRLLLSKTPVSSGALTSSSPQSNKKSIKDAANQSAGVNKVGKLDECIKESTETTGLPLNFSNPYNFATPPFLNPASSTSQQISIPSTALNSFPSSTVTSVHHMPFEPNLYRNGHSPLLHHQTGSLHSNSLPQPQSAFLNSLRFSGLSPIDLNCVNNASKLLASQQANATQFLNNKKIESSIHHERLISPKSGLGNGLLAGKLTPNGLHRKLNTNLNQNSSSMLNTSNNSNLSTSSKKDENRSSPPRHLNNNNVSHVGVGFPTFIDPYGELLQQAATACLIPFASK